MNEPDMNDPEQIIAKFKELETRLRDSNHRVNQSINSAITGLVDQTERQDEVLQHINSCVRLVQESLQRVEQCLVGDPKYNQVGLLKEVEALKAKQVTDQAAVELRLKQAEDKNEETAVELKTQRRLASWTFVVLATLGAIITWIRSSNIFNYFKGP